MTRAALDDLREIPAFAHRRAVEGEVAEITGEIAHAWLRSASGPGRTVRTVFAIGQTFRATRAGVEVFPLGAVKLAGIALIIASGALLKIVI